MSPASTVVISREGSVLPSPAEIPLVSITPQLHVESTPHTVVASAEPVTGTSTKPEVIQSEEESGKASPATSAKSGKVSPAVSQKSVGKASSRKSVASEGKASPALSQKSATSKGKASPALSSRSVAADGKASSAKSLTEKKSVKASPSASRSGSKGSVASKKGGE